MKKLDAVGTLVYATIVAGAIWFVLWPTLKFIGKGVNQFMNLVDTNDTIMIMCVVGILLVGIVIPALWKRRMR